MKILIVAQGLHLGGRERFTAWLASQLARRGHAVILGVRGEVERDHYPVDPRVAVVRLHDRYTMADVPSRASGVRSPGLVGTWARAARRGYRTAVFGGMTRQLARSSKPDVVVPIGAQISMATLAALLGSALPVVATERENPFVYSTPQAIQRTRVLLYRRAAGVVVLLEQVARRVRSDWGLEQVDVIPNAQMFAAGFLQPLEQRPPVVLYTGRLSEAKGLTTLLRAWQRSGARQHGWRLRLVGEGPQRGELEGLVTGLRIAESVEMPGAVRDVEAEYRAARVFVLPSRGEGFGNSLLEAMTFGCACIATDCPGGPGVLLNQGDAGVLVPVDDVAELSAAIDRVTSDPALASSLGELARLRAEDFQAEGVLDRWEALLARAARSNGGHGSDGHQP